MYALKRFAAYAIDVALVWTPIALLLEFTPLMAGFSPRIHMFATFGAWGFTFAGPILVNGILTGLPDGRPASSSCF